MKLPEETAELLCCAVTVTRTSLGDDRRYGDDSRLELDTCAMHMIIVSVKMSYLRSESITARAQRLQPRP